MSAESAGDYDMLIRMGRRTEWLEPEAGVYLGMGQRMLATDVDDYPLMDVRRIVLDTEDQGEAAAVWSGAAWKNHGGEDDGPAN